MQLENFGALLYRREAVADGDGSAPAGRAVLQRHEASKQEADNMAGKGTLVSELAYDAAYLHTCIDTSRKR